MRRTSTPLLAVALIGLAAGCGLPFQVIIRGTPGSGKIVEERRSVEAFSAVEAGGALRITVTLGEAPSLTLKGDDNLLPLITSYVTDGCLVLGQQPNTGLNPSQPIEAIVVTPKLVRVVAE